MLLTFEGKATLGIGERIELPSVAEILRSPMFVRAEIDDFYKHGGEFNRYLLDKCPISHEFEYVCVTINLKAVAPGLMPMGTTDWHCDGSVGCCYFSHEERFHIFNGYCDLVTDFLEEEATLEADESIIGFNHFEFRCYVESNINRVNNLKPMQTQEQSFITFNSKHLHRAPGSPSKSCFRLSMIVRESNHYQANTLEKALQTTSPIWRDENDKPGLSIEQKNTGIILRPFMKF